MVTLRRQASEIVTRSGDADSSIWGIVRPAAMLDNGLKRAKRARTIVNQSEGISTMTHKNCGGHFIGRRALKGGLCWLECLKCGTVKQHRNLMKETLTTIARKQYV